MSNERTAASWSGRDLEWVRDLRGRAERVLQGTQTGVYMKRTMAHDMLRLVDLIERWDAGERERARILNETLSENARLLSAAAERDALRAETALLHKQVEELDDRNRWRWPNERERRSRAEATLEELVDDVLRDELKPIALRQRARAALAAIREEAVA